MKLKNLKNLNVLGKNEQKAIAGEGYYSVVYPPTPCFSNWDCWLSHGSETICWGPGPKYCSIWVA